MKCVGYVSAILCMIVWCCTIDTLAAQTINYQGDCQRIALSSSEDRKDSVEALVGYTSDIKKNMILAVTHLERYCLSLQKKKTDTNALKTAQSPRLYDHLIDIGWRSLDAQEDNEYNVVCDPQGAQWRDDLYVMISKTEGILPKQLSDTYLQQREGSDGLAKKYENRCYTAALIEQTLLPDRLSQILDSVVDVCLTRATQRVSRETEYIQYRQKQLSTNVAKTVRQKYLNEDLLQRFEGLIDVMHYYEQDFTNVTRKVQGTKQCT